MDAPPPCKHSSLMDPYSCDSCIEIERLELQVEAYRKVLERIATNPYSTEGELFHAWAREALGMDA
jgi:hypothetical protein